MYITRTIIFVIVLIITVELMRRRKSSVPDGQVVADRLTVREKLIVWVISIFNPIIGGAILYYGWRKKLPEKAKQANKISIIVFLIEFLIGFSLGFMQSYPASH